MASLRPRLRGADASGFGPPEVPGRIFQPPTWWWKASGAFLISICWALASDDGLRTESLFSRMMDRACKEITCSMNFKKQRPDSPFFFEKEQVIFLRRLSAGCAAGTRPDKSGSSRREYWPGCGCPQP